MRYLIVAFLSFFILHSGYGQKVQKPEFEKKIDGLLQFTIPIITVEEAKAIKNEVVFLDAREEEEYKVSHIPGARYIGYDHFKINHLQNIPKDADIVVYCSIGYRSEKVGELLKVHGYNKVSNLYGSIFEWANCGYQLENDEGVLTKKVHAYNKSWSQWITHPEIIKVY